MRSGIDCNGIRWEEKELSWRMVDLRTKIFCRLTPLFPVNNTNNNGGTFWLCQCECGNQVVRSKSTLVHGDSESCGCLVAEKRKNLINNNRRELIGQKFGKLTVVDIAEIRIEPKGYERVYYKCLCDCGNDKPVIVRGTSLKTHHVISCGCAKKDKEARDRVDFVGKRFGALTVMSFAYAKDNIGYWNCMCDCGNPIIVRTAHLTNGAVTSCGCTISIGEMYIMKILDDANIIYLHNKGYFKDLISANGRKLRYDFIILDGNQTPSRLIEFDGPQHQRPYDGFGGIESFLIQQENDTLKNQYALSHNIPLVRIPYSKRDSITLDDILGNQYLIKGDN